MPGTSRLLVRLLLVLPVLAVLALLPTAAASATRSESSANASLDQGKALYREHCQRCHGKKGRGDGPDAVRLGFRPRDFTLGSFKCRCTPSGSLPRDEDLLRVVERGLPGTSMRGFAEVLSEAESRSVVEYVKSLAPAFAEGVAPPCVEVPPPSAATADSVAEGRLVYRLLRCWTCHGAEGRGDGPAAKALLDDWGGRLRVYDFTRPDRFKCGGDDDSLYRLLHTGLAGSPMPSYSSALAFSAKEVGDLAPLAEIFGEAAIGEIRSYLSAQPQAESVAAMTAPERKALGDRRAWALIHYLRSLVGR